MDGCSSNGLSVGYYPNICHDRLTKSKDIFSYDRCKSDAVYVCSTTITARSYVLDVLGTQN
jgi:hypothetical protein